MFLVMNEKIEALLSQYGLTYDQLKDKTKRKIQRICKIEANYKEKGEWSKTIEATYNDLWEDVQDEMLDVYEELKEQQQQEQQQQPQKKSFLDGWI